MRVQRVLMPDGAESWTVLDASGGPVPAVEGLLSHLQALDWSPMTIRTYATSPSCGHSSWIDWAWPSTK